MAMRYQTVTQLTAQSALDMTQRRGNWTRFLDTAARLYKYPFPDQLAIYAQRPDATACAPIELWNVPFGRFVRRGSKGIALIDDAGQYPRLKYVFDISDTEQGRSDARNVNLWEMRPEHEGTVLEALSGAFGDFEGNLAEALRNVAGRLVREYYEDNSRDIGYSAEGSFLGDYGESDLGAAFRDAATVGAAYSIMTRCGMDAGEHFSDEDFQSVFDFNTESAIYALGMAVSEISERVLREIEVTVKNYERRLAAERGADYGRENGADVQRERGLLDSRPVGGRGAGAGAADEIRNHAAELPQSTQNNLVQFPVVGRDAAPSPSGYTDGSGEPDGQTDETAPVEEPAPGQSDGSNGLDSAYEQLERPSGGDGAQRTDLHLTEESATDANETPPEQGGVSSSSRYKVTAD